MNMHKKKSLQFLRAYQNETAVTPANLLAWEGEAIQAQNDKEIFVVKCGLRRGIPNFDTFLALNFTLADVRVLSDWKVSGIPKGDPMPSMDYQYPA